MTKTTRQRWGLRSVLTGGSGLLAGTLAAALIHMAFQRFEVLRQDAALASVEERAQDVSDRSAVFLPGGYAVLSSSASAATDAGSPDPLLSGPTTAAETTPHDFSRLLPGRAKSKVTVVVFDDENRWIGWLRSEGPNELQTAKPLPPEPDEVQHAQGFLSEFQPNSFRVPAQQRQVRQETYVYAQAVSPSADSRYRVVAFAPLSAFPDTNKVVRGQMLWTGALFAFVVMAVAFFLSDRIASRLRTLAEEARRLDGMALTQPLVYSSGIQEVDDLGAAQTTMRESVFKVTEALKFSQRRLEDLIASGLTMSREKDQMALLRQMLLGARQLTGCEAATLYIVTDRHTLKFALRTRDDVLPVAELSLVDSTGRENTQFVAAYAALRNEVVVVEDIYQETRFDFSGTRAFDATSGYRTVSMLALPLAPREGEVIGVLQLMNALHPKTGDVVPFQEESIRLASALAAQAAVLLDNHQLVNAQQELIDAMVRMIAGAIDAKSPYTGSHCERVPELAFMLAEEATRTQEGPLAEFGFHTPEQWREFRIGAWLHDCGKVTTPEYVVDKATKLETIYDRIHEIRTRMEILWRDAEITHLQACLAGQDPVLSTRQRDAKQASLVEDFAVIAECNIGGEFMVEDKITHLQRIGGQAWLRHFDDRLGISQGAHARLASIPVKPAPAWEKLLDDKEEHIVKRPADTTPDARYGFQMQMPENLYNLGELHNLSIRHGTLTAEERYKINEHIIQTIVMLDAMPFPKNLSRVPEYAGNHHETLKGNGYPRGLVAEQLSIPSRIMAVADIFEALTASDRPYKKSKTLSEAIRILWGFKKRGHIDAAVFDLFLSSGVYLRYAHRFLSPELIDNVDINLYLGAVSAEEIPHF